MSELNIRIDWSELDLYGHVNNVMIFKYIQASRIHYCERIGMDTLNEGGDRPGFIVAASNVLYKKKILYPGQLRVESHVPWIRNTSFQLDHIIYGENGERLVEAYDIIVVYDYKKGGKTPVTDQLRKNIERVEDRLFRESSKEAEQGQYPDIE